MSELLIPSLNISKLDLSGQNLTEIPTIIFELKNLKHLNLSNNKISTIPKEITKLRRLECLDVSNNKISNFYAKICQLPKLQILNLNNNLIKTIPKQIKHLTQLKALHISNNQLSFLPNEIKELKNLQKLNISKNSFENFPEDIIELKKLTTLWINSLNLKTFPTVEILEELINLKAIYCFGKLLDLDLIDNNYRELSKVKGNSFSELIKLNSIDKRKNTIKMPTKKEVKTTKNKIFISYSHQDSNWLKEVKKNLKVLQFNDVDFETWDDTKIKSGSKWKIEIGRALNECRIAILLISTDFLASDFIQNDELPPLLKKAKEDGTVILPLIVGHSRFTRSKTLKDFQAVNDPNNPLISCSKAERQKILVKLTDDVESYLQN